MTDRAEEIARGALRGGTNQSLLDDVTDALCAYGDEIRNAALERAADQLNDCTAGCREMHQEHIRALKEKTDD